MINKTEKLYVVFAATFAILLLFYYVGKPDFVLVDKEATDKKVSNSKSIGLALILSTIVTAVAYMVVKPKPSSKTPSLAMNWRMGCGCDK